MVKIIYLDIDGTLRDEINEITKNVKDAIRKCREKGIYIIVCTGRNPGSIQEDVRNLEMDGIISGGGCFIQLGSRMLKSEHFSVKVIEKILKLIHEQNLGASLESKEEIYMNHNAAEFYRKDFEKKFFGYPHAEQAKKKNKIQYEDNFIRLQEKSRKIHKICLIGREESVSEAERRFGEISQIVQKRRWNEEWYLELLPKDCGKGKAVCEINKRLGIRKENSMSFGDGDNDIEMFLETGVNVAVKGASQQLLKYADSICETPSEDGIPKELEKRGIIEACKEPLKAERKYKERRVIGNGKRMVAARGCLSNLSKEF